MTKNIKEFYFGGKLTRDKELNVTNVCKIIKFQFNMCIRLIDLVLYELAVDR